MIELTDPADKKKYVRRFIYSNVVQNGTQNTLHQELRVPFTRRNNLALKIDNHINEHQTIESSSVFCNYHLSVCCRKITNFIPLVTVNPGTTCSANIFIRTYYWNLVNQELFIWPRTQLDYEKTAHCPSVRHRSGWLLIRNWKHRSEHYSL